jgi:predicted transcriptional regulator
MPSASSIPISTLTRMNSTLKDLFLYIYDLSTLETDLLITLVKGRKTMTLEQLAKQADRDKSTVFRSLQKLVTLGIISKETRTLKEGGYSHIYRAIPIEMFKLETEKRVKELEASLNRLMKKFENDLERMAASFYMEQA